MNVLLKGLLRQGNYDLEVDHSGFTGQNRFLFFRKTDLIYNICPSDASIKFNLCKKERSYKVELEILCGCGPFVLMSETSSIETSMNDLLRQTEEKLTNWRRQRFKEDNEIRSLEGLRERNL